MTLWFIKFQWNLFYKIGENDFCLFCKLLIFNAYKMIQPLKAYGPQLFFKQMNYCTWSF